MQRCIKSLKKEGFRFVYLLHETDVENLEIAYTKLWNDKTGEHGPFDIIGDVHGCCDELEELLSLLGYRNRSGGYAHPDGRKAIFLGDLSDRGPRIMDTFQLAMKMVSAGNALIVYGHTPTSEVIEKNHTYCIDTGCVFGGKLTAFRYPERELVSIDAHKQYAVPARALKGFDLISIGPRATQRPPPRRSSEIK